MKKCFLICPVRGHDMSETEDVVANLEANGWAVHWPPRDTDQNADELNICEENKRAIESADQVFIIWDENSKGSHFDLGMAFALSKPISVLDIVACEEGKSFAKMLKRWRV